MHSFSAKIPLARLLIPFVVGIGVAYSFHFHLSLAIVIVMLVLFCTAIILHKKLLQRSLEWSGADGIFISIAFLLAGIGMTSAKMDNQNALPDYCGKTVALNVRLLNDPVEKEKSMKLLVEVRAWKNGTWKPSGEKMIVYLAREAAAEKLRYGDELLLQSSPELIDGPKNPGEFDYRAWLQRQGIRAQAFVKSGEWQLLQRAKGNFFKASALDLRRYFLEKLRSYGLGGPEFGVAAALLLGESDHLDPGLLQAYSASGTLHVLSVSGMHVALVYIVLLRLLAPLEKRKQGKWLSIVLQLLFLWFYATLTGLCPSVLRSVTMLSVVIAGRAFNRHAHVLNSLAASALILLLTDPLLLLDIGFQLSYLAVAGIVLLQPMLEKKLEPQFWITRQLWSLVSVTLVAQVFTFPLGLYYFHQFPTYFLLSNLIVIPLSTITMYAGLLLLIVSPLALIAKPVAIVFGFLVKLLNVSVTQIESLPFSVMHSAKWMYAEMFLLYAFIVLLLFYFAKRNVRLLQFSLGTFLGLLLFVAFEKNTRLRSKELVIFDLKHSSAIAVVNGNEDVILADTSLLKRKGDIDFHIDPFLEENGLNCENFFPLNESMQFSNSMLHASGEWMQAAGKRIAIAGRAKEFQPVSGDCDILLLRANSSARLDSLLATMKPKLVVADGSDGKRKTEKWKACCKALDVPFYDVKENGALIIRK